MLHGKEKSQSQVLLHGVALKVPTRPQDSMQQHHTLWLALATSCTLRQQPKAVLLPAA